MCSARHPATALPGAETAACSGIAEIRSGLGGAGTGEDSTFEKHRKKKPRWRERSRVGGLAAVEALPAGSQWSVLPMYLEQGSCLELACVAGKSGVQQGHQGWALSEGGCWAECPSCIPLYQDCFSPAGLTRPGCQPQGERVLHFPAAHGSLQAKGPEPEGLDMAWR